jgi:hypothetical protein
MSYPINYPTPQNANVQIFYGPDSSTSTSTTRTWVKPQGASFVWFTLIGAGGNGDGTTGGGSGAVTNFMCPAFLIPDSLRVTVPSSAAGVGTQIRYQQKDTAGYQLLVAASANGSVAGQPVNGNAFTAMGFFQTVAGQDGVTGNISASTTTFLSGGSGGPSGSVTANYGYSTSASGGFFQMSPIIVGLGGSTNDTSDTGKPRGGIGCGGSYLSGVNNGGPGLAVIITW